jgi:hypothetical protein
MIELAALAVLAVTVCLVFSLVLLKMVVWIVLLPIRLLFGLLVLPWPLLKALAGGLMLLVVGLVLAVALIAAVVAVLPFLPLLFIAFVVWFVLRASGSRAIAR